MWPGTFLSKDQTEKLPMSSLPSSPVTQNHGAEEDDRGGQELVVSKHRRDNTTTVHAMPALSRPNIKKGDTGRAIARSESMPTYMHNGSPPSSMSSSQHWSAQRPGTSSSRGVQSSAFSGSDYTNIVNLALQLNALRRNPLSSPINAGHTSNISPQVEPGSMNPLLNELGQGSHPAAVPQLQQAVSNNSIHQRYSSLPITQQEQNALGHNRRLAGTHSSHDEYVNHPISDSTAARVEKVRQHFELFVEYMRLLPHLPPLHERPASSDSNSDNVSGGHHGRGYNPLQYIRNRKVRFRERNAIDTQPSCFENVSQVSKWVDTIVTNTPRKALATTDCLDLPNITDRPSLVSATAADPDSQQIHHEGKSSKASSLTGNTASDLKPRRPRFDWVFTPANLLTDADWLEKDDNKLKIEDRDGNNIFHRSTKFIRFPPHDAPTTSGDQPLLVVDAPPLDNDGNQYWSTVEHEDPIRSSFDSHLNRPHHRHRFSSSLQRWRDQQERKHKQQKSKATRYDSETDSDAFLRSSPLAQSREKTRWDASGKSTASSSTNREYNDTTIHDTASGGARGRSHSHNRHHKHFLRFRGRHRRRSPSTSDSDIRKSSESGRDSLDSISHLPPPQYPNITMDLSSPSSRAGSPTKGKKEFNCAFEARSPSTGSRSNIGEEVARGDLIRASFLKGSKIAELGKDVTRKGDRYLSDKFSLDSYSSTDSSDDDNDNSVGSSGNRLRRRSSKYLSAIPGNSTIPEESDQNHSNDSKPRGSNLHEKGGNEQVKGDRDAETSSTTPVAGQDSEDGGAIVGGPDMPEPIASPPGHPSAGGDENGSHNAQGGEYNRQKSDSASHATPQDVALKFVKSQDEVDRAEQLTLSHKHEIDRVRALLLCSGIKASALIHQMNAVAEPPVHHFRDLDLPNEASLMASLRVPRRQQAVATMNALVHIYDNEVRDMQEPMTHFNSHTLPDIRASITQLQTFVNDTLYPRIFEISTEADELSNDLSTTSTLAVKQLHDILDQGQRIRRRRFRWISRPGYVILEWFLIFVMWAVWFFVTIFRVIRGLWRIAIRCLKWVLWL